MCVEYISRHLWVFKIDWRYYVLCIIHLTIFIVGNLLVRLLASIIQQDKYKQSAVSLYYNTYIQGIVQGETVKLSEQLCNNKNIQLLKVLSLELYVELLKHT